MKTAKNILDKIWQNHVVSQKKNHPAILAIDFMLLHEVTSAQAFDTLNERNLQVPFPKNLLATIDHSIPTDKDRINIKDVLAKKQVEMLRANTKKHGIKFYDFGSQHQGIVHVIGPELGITQPGMTIVCGDSHTSTHGAFGALAFGIGTSVVGHVLATGALLMNKPKVMHVQFNGKLQKGVYAKDMILKLISKIGVGGANGHIIEFSGNAITSLSMEARMSICNMSIECGAIAGLIAPDQTTYEYIKGKQFAPNGDKWNKAINHWETLKSDANATYDKTVTIDVDNLEPMVTWGTNPAQGIQINEKIPTINNLPKAQQHMAREALKYVKLAEQSAIQGTKINWAFIGSCTNGRIEDLRLAAKILKQHKINSTVKMYIVPGSEQVYQQAVQEGLDKIFTDAGADFRLPGCSMCIGMNEDKVPDNERCISSTNRNFVGRQGPGSITHLASPATVAASAIAGFITSCKEYNLR